MDGPPLKAPVDASPDPRLTRHGPHSPRQRPLTRWRLALRPRGRKAGGPDTLEQNHLLQRAQELAGLGTYTIDHDRRVISLSRETARMFGAGDRAIDLPVDEFRRRFPNLDDLTRHFAETGEAYRSLTSRVVRGDGEVSWIQTRSTVERPTKGPRFVLGVVQDITALVRSRESDRLLSTLVESSDDIIITTDLAGRFTSWNPAAERLYGYSTSEAVGRHISLIATPAFDPKVDFPRFDGELTA